MTKKKSTLMNGNKTNKGQGFETNPQNAIHKGRPRKLVSHVLKGLKDKGITPVSVDEIKDVYLSLVNSTKEELKEIKDDINQPFLTQRVAESMVDGKGMNILEGLLDRSIGKATQFVEETQTIIGAKPDIDKIKKALG